MNDANFVKAKAVWIAMF